jgi:hypothetical protein
MIYYDITTYICQLHSLAHLAVHISLITLITDIIDIFPHFRCRPLHNQLGVPLILGTDDVWLATTHSA